MITYSRSKLTFTASFYVFDCQLLIDSLSRTIFHYDLKKGSKEELKNFCYLYKYLKTAYDKQFPNSKRTNERVQKILDEMTY
jgi:hypothetical protein